MSSPSPNFRQGGDFAPRSPKTAEALSTDEARTSSHDFSIVVGGPVYDFLQRIGLIRLAVPNVVRRITAIVIITWLPLLILSIKDGVAIGSRVAVPLLHDYSMYGRFLLGLPLLLFAEVVIDPGIRSAITHFVGSGLVQEKELAGFEAVLHRARRWRNAVTPELALLVLAFFPTFIFRTEWQHGAIASWHSTATGLTAAGWWYAAVSTPFLRFILYRWAFRYVIWVLLLWKVSRLPLHLLPIHPDRAAGLGFLSLTQARFGILFCALGCSFAGHVADSILHAGASLDSFKVLIVAFIVLSVAVGVCPLLVWLPTLARVRRVGLQEYATLGTRYTEEFDQKWVHTSDRPSDQLLGASDIQSLADLGNSYSVIQEMSVVPITKGLAIKLAVFAGLPLIPVLIAITPTKAIVNAILKMVA